MWEPGVASGAGYPSTGHSPVSPEGLRARLPSDCTEPKTRMRSAPNCHWHVRLGPPGLFKTVPPTVLTLAAGATALIARFRKRSFGFWSRLAAGQNGWAIFTVRDAVQGWLDDQVEDNCHGSFGAETRARCEKTLLPFMDSLRIE